MKLTPLQKHYNEVFKSYHKLVVRHNKRCRIDQRIDTNILYSSISTEIHSFRGVNKLAKKILNISGFKILDASNYSTKSSNSNSTSTLYRLELEMEVYGKKVKINFQHSLCVYGFYENDELFFENSVLYKPMTNMCNELHDSIDWDKKYSEEELFQLSCVHDLDIPLLQALYKISTELQKLNDDDNVSAISIYNTMNKLRRTHGEIFKRD